MKVVEIFSSPSNSSIPDPNDLHDGTCILGLSQQDNVSGMRVRKGEEGWPALCQKINAGEKKVCFLLTGNSTGVLA